MTTPGTLSMSHSVTQACTPQTSVPYTADDPTIIRLLFCFFSAKLPHTRRLFPATEYTKIPRLVSLPPVLLRICPAVPVTSERKLYKWNSCDRTTGIFYNFSPSVPRQSLKRPRRLWGTLLGPEEDSGMDHDKKGAWWLVRRNPNHKEAGDMDDKKIGAWLITCWFLFKRRQSSPSCVLLVFLNFQQVLRYHDRRAAFTDLVSGTWNSTPAHTSCVFFGNVRCCSLLRRLAVVISLFCFGFNLEKKRSAELFERLQCTSNDAGTPWSYWRSCISASRGIPESRIRATWPRVICSDFMDRKRTTGTRGLAHGLALLFVLGN